MENRRCCMRCKCKSSMAHNLWRLMRFIMYITLTVKANKVRRDTGVMARGAAQTVVINLSDAEYSGRTRFTPWLVIPCVSPSPGYQQPWCWLYRIWGIEYNHLLYLSLEKVQKMWIYTCNWVLIQKYSTHKWWNWPIHIVFIKSFWKLFVIVFDLNNNIVGPNRI